MTFRFAALMAALLPILAHAQGPYERMLAEQEMVRVYLENEAVKITERAQAEVLSRHRWEPLQEQRRAEMLDMLGLNPAAASYATQRPDHSHDRLRRIHRRKHRLRKHAARLRDGQSLSAEEP